MSSKICNDPLEQILQKLKITEWDWLLVGDGSGSSWPHACGWGCVSIEKDTFIRRLWLGAFNGGTNNISEAMAYFLPLCWYVSEELKTRASGSEYKIKHVHIVTDSNFLKSVGNQIQEGKTAAKNPIFAVFSYCKAQGVFLHWHWLPRNQLALNEFVDGVSKLARKQVEELPLPTRDGNPVDIYCLNPSK